MHLKARRASLSALPILASLTLCSAAVSAQSAVLILDDTPAATEAYDAAVGLGHDVTDSRTVAQFLTRGDASPDGWDLIIVDISQFTFASQVVTFLEEQIDDGAAVIVSHGNTDAVPALRTLLDITCSGVPRPPTIVSAPSGGIDIFSSPNEVPSPLVGLSDAGDLGDHCTPNSGGRILATSPDDGPPIIVTSRGDQVMFQGLVYNAFRTGDEDEDDVLDVVELLQNQITLMLALNAQNVVTFGDFDTALTDHITEQTGLTFSNADSLASLDTALADEPTALFIAYDDITAADAGLTSRIDTARAANIPVLFFSPDLDGSAAWQTYLDVQTSGSTDTAAALFPGASAFQQLAFNTDNLLDSVPVGVDGAGDSGDVISSTSLWPMARFGAAGGDVAMVGSADGGLIVGAFSLSDLSTEDTNEDEVSEVAAFFENVLDTSRSLRRGPLTLVASDTSVEARPSRAFEAVERSNLVALAPTDVDVITATLTNDPISVLLIENVENDAAWLQDASFVAAVDAWVSAGNPTVFAGVDLDSATDLGDALGVTATADITSAVAVTADNKHLGRHFNLPTSTPRTLPAGTLSLTDFGDVLETDEVAAPAANFPSGAATFSKNNGRLIVNGFSPLSAGQTDSDLDGTTDSVQLLVGQLYAVQNPQTALILDTDTSESVLGEAARRTGLATVEIADTAAFATAYDDAETAPALLVVDSSNADTLADPDVWSRVQAWVEGGGNLVVAFPGVVTHPDIQTYFEINASAASGSFAIVEPFTDVAGLFRRPYLVPSPLNGGAGDRAILDVDDPNRGAAAYGSNFGPTALVLARGGAASVAGFSPRSLNATDLNSDNIDDRVALFTNEMIRSGLTPVPVLDGPFVVDEGDIIRIDAGDSLDPSGERISYGWDVDLDGDYSDAITDSITFNARDIDGPQIHFIGLRLTNDSGLSTTTRIPITVNNVAPTIAAGTDRTIAQGTLTTFNASVTDVADDTYAVTWDFGDGSPTANGEEVQYAFDALGEYTVTVTAVDDDGGTTVETFVVDHVNAPPTIDIAPVEAAEEGTEITLTATVVDPGGDDFSVAWDFADGGTATGTTVQHTFADDGSFEVVVTATDELDAAHSETVTVEITNVVPIITSTPTLTVESGELYSYDITVEDPGDETFIYLLNAGPAAADLNQDGMLRWTPGVTGYDDQTFELLVGDGDGGEAVQEWIVEVTFQDTDDGGAPDRCEEAFGFDIDDPADDIADPDMDGLTTADECLSGQDPTVFSGPAAPTLLEPLDGTAVRQPFVRFLIENVVDPDGDAVVYDFQLYLDDTLVAEILDVEEMPTGSTSALFEEEFVEDGVYTWRARGRAMDVAGPWSEPFTFVFNQINLPPERPSIISPEGFSDDDPTVLRVGNSTDPEGEALVYDFEIYYGNQPGEDFLVYAITDIAEGEGGETAHEVTEMLEEGRQYLWRARAKDASGGSSPYAAASFEIDAVNSPPPAPVPTSPIDGDVLEPVSSVVLAWENVVDPDGDRITYSGTLATDSGFSENAQTFIVEEDLSGTETLAYIPLQLIPDTHYYWRVSADDGRFVSDFAFAEFDTSPAFVNSAPPMPVPLSPLGRESFDEGDEVVFAVENSVDPDGDLVYYDLEIALDVGMGRLVSETRFPADRESDQTAYAMADLPPLDMFWRIRATDGSLASEWTAVTGFSVDSAPVVLPDVGLDAGTDAFPEDVYSGPTSGPLGGGGGCSVAAPNAGMAWWLGATLLGLVSTRRRR